jgi:hypothetical protein
MIALRAVERVDGDALHAIFKQPGVDAACGQGASTIRQDDVIVGLVALRRVDAGRDLMAPGSDAARLRRGSQPILGWPFSLRSPERADRLSQGRWATGRRLQWSTTSVGTSETTTCGNGHDALRRSGT